MRGRVINYLFLIYSNFILEILFKHVEAQCHLQWSLNLDNISENPALTETTDRII